MRKKVHPIWSYDLSMQKIAVIEDLNTNKSILGRSGYEIEIFLEKNG